MNDSASLAESIDVEKPAYQEQEPKAGDWFFRLTYFAIKYTFGFLVRGIWVKKVMGLENIPEEGGVIVAFNHQSYFDFICFIAICPRQVHFLSAEKFFKSLFWLPLMKMTGQIRVNRQAHDKQELHAAVHSHLQAGKVIGIFPEGTRAPDPKEMLTAFTGVARYATRVGVPVIPVGIVGAHEVMSRHDHWPKFKKNISFHIGMPIIFTEHNHRTHDEATYQHLTTRIMLEIARLSGKKYAVETPL